MHSIVCIKTNIAKIWLSLYFMECVRFAWYRGKMYSRHLFSYRGLTFSFSVSVMVSVILLFSQK